MIIRKVSPIMESFITYLNENSVSYKKIKLTNGLEVLLSRTKFLSSVEEIIDFYFYNEEEEQFLPIDEILYLFSKRKININ